MKFRELVNQAREIESSTSRFYLEKTTSIRSELNKINLDRMLSGEGRIQKMYDYRQQSATELIRQADQRKKDYVKVLSEAKIEAEKVIKNGIKKPSEEQIKDFENSLRRLKTEIMLTNRYEAAEAKLNEFVGQISDPYIANQMADMFIDIIPQVLSISNEPVKAKVKLSAMYDRLNNDFLPDEIKEAKTAIQYVNAASQNPQLFSLVAISNANDLLGNGHGNYLNKTEDYLNKIEGGQE
jgi:hypothetical protein